MGNKFSLSLSTKLSIGLFLCIGFGFLSLLTVAMGMYNAAGSVSRGYEAEKARNATISTTEGSLATEVILAERAALGDNDLRDALRPKIEALQSTADQSKSLNRSGLDGAITKFNTVLNGVFSKDSAERLNAAHDLGLSYQSEILGQLADARQQSVELAHNGQAAVNQNRAFAASLAFALFLCAAGMGGLCRWQLKNRLFKPLAIIDSRLVSLRDAVDSRLKFGLSHLAEGDLSIRVETALPSLNFGTNDEMGQLAKTYNAIAQDIEAALTAYNLASSGLNELVSQVAESADLVHNTAQSVSQAAQESGSASREIAGGSEQLAVNSTEAAKIIDGLAKQSNDVSDGCATQLNLVGQVDQSLNEAASGVTDLASNAQHMSAMATEGNQAVREAVNAMNSVREKVLFSAQKVRELDQKGQQIGAIVATIDQIAEQTNLLALNAAIEAARAGEHGRGFAIVAEEVRKLAEQSSASTHEIAELIQSIRQTVHESVKAIEITATDSEAGADRSSRAGQILADVQTAANSVSSQAERLTILTHQAANSMREVAVATRSNAESAKAMVKGTNLVANTIMEVASFSEQSAAGAQELTAAVSEVGQSARKLDELGIELQSAVSKFQLELQPKGKKLRLAS